MQPKFTQQNLLSFCARTITMLLFVAAFSQVTFAQLRPGAKKAQVDAVRAQKTDFINRSTSLTTHSVGRAPVRTDLLRVEDNQPDAVTSRAFCYNGAGPFQLNKQLLTNTVLTPIGATVPFVFPGAAAWVSTTNKMYVIDQGAPFALYIVDTLAGIRTFVANCTGVPQANFTGMTWDPTTNTMYGVSTSITASQIFTINITTGVCTPIGSPSAVSPGAIQLNAAPGGSLFSTDIVNDNLVRWNKTTGVPTVIGPLGFNANFGQDGHFDMSDGQYFAAVFNATAGAAQLRIIDTLTGSSTLVGTYGGQVETLAIYPVPQVACSGTPAPGNTMSTTNPVCPSAPFVLTPQFNPVGLGVTYQWQSSPDGSSWTDIPGPAGTAGSLLRTQTVATYYRVRVTCSGNSTFTVPTQVTMSPLTDCYCVPTYSTGCGFGDFIARVRISTLDNSTMCSTPPYTYYNAVPAPILFLTGTYPLIVTVGPDTFGQNVQAWIDFNQDGDFTDAGESVGGPVNAGASGTVTYNVTIPANAVVGQTRMRIRGGDDTPTVPIPPCGASASAFGEAEDYNVNIQPCIQGVFTSHPANTTTTCGGNATFAVAATGSALTFSWEYRVNSSSPWLNVVDGGIYSGATTNTLVIRDIPQTMSGYQYRALMQGPCTAIDFSNTATLTVGPLVATVSPTSATICNGQIQQLTLTNPTSVPVYGPPSALPLAIPDNNAAGTSTTINVSGVPAGATITGVSVTFTMTHTWVGDIVMNLKSPDNDVLNLIGLLDGGTGSNGTANFTNTTVSSSGVTAMSGAPAPRTGTFRADAFHPISFPSTMPTTTNTWAPLLAGVVNGNWSLGICDLGPADLGNLTSWSIVISYTATPAQGVWTSSAPGTMWINAGATVPYVPGSLANTIWVNPTTTTTYSVVYSTPTPCVSAPTNITVNVSNPIGAITQPPSTRAVCVGSSTTITASALGGPISYQWLVSTNGGATYTPVSGATGTTLTLNNVTQTMHNNRYRLAMNVAVCNSRDTTTATVLTVNPLPTVTITSPNLNIVPGVSTTITASSTPGPQTPTSWTWFYNGAQIVTTPPTNSNTISVDIDHLGTYQARVTDVNGCVNVSNELVIGAQSSDRLWIYPNPSTGQFQVRVFYDGPYADIRSVMIYDGSGRLVKRKDFDLFVSQPPYLQMDFDMSAFPAGTYLVKVEEKFTGKIKSGWLILQ